MSLNNKKIEPIKYQLKTIKDNYKLLETAAVILLQVVSILFRINK